MPTSVGELQGVSLIMSGDHNMYQKTKSYLDGFECPRCGHCCQALETEPFEYWNAVEGWVKIDEVREHFDAVGCGTIYKSAGEGRTPLYTTPPKAAEWVGLTDEDIHDAFNFTEMVKQLSWDREPKQWCENFAAYIEVKLKGKNHG